MWRHTYNFHWLIVASCSLMLICSSMADFSCVSCDSNTKGDCLKDVNAIDDVIACTQSQSCYTKLVDNQKVVRGCLRKGEKCEEPTCMSCKEANCNKNNICKFCNSTEDANCAQSTAEAANVIICPKADTKCMVNVLEKNTVRGCITEKIETSCTEEKTCKSCTGGVCNVGIFPADRRLCYQCAATNTTCASAPTGALPCRQYQADDKCYIYDSDGSQIARGCVSDTGGANKCANDNALCQICNTNKCNNKAYFTCIRCRSDNDPGCRIHADKMGGSACRNSVNEVAEQKCFTGIWNNNLVIRGCLVDLEQRDQFICNDPSNKNCVTCNTTNCNTAAVSGASFAAISKVLLAVAVFTLWRLN